jgi:glycerate 2-kinase
VEASIATRTGRDGAPDEAGGSGERRQLEIRELIGSVSRAALTAVDGRTAVRRALEADATGLRIAGNSYPRARLERVLLVAVGKAALAMERGARDVLGDSIAAATVTAPAGLRHPSDRSDVWYASHPVPDTHGLAGAAEALNLARSAREGDLLLFLLSGGASALWPAPPAGVTLDELRRTTAALLRSGAPIREINTVRKHLSRIAGGRLAAAAHPARVATLIVSDVVGSPLDVIGSGPTVPDPTSYDDALGVIRSHSVEVPASVVLHLQAGAAGELAETPKPGDPVFEHAAHAIVARNRDALEAAARAATRAGATARIVSDSLEGEARLVAAAVAGELRQARRERSAGDPPLVLLWGGETTVVVRGDGVGGRNQELALAAAVHLDGTEGVALAALGTDGIDGPTPAAGAVVDGSTLERARAAGLDAVGHLRRNDAHTLLRAAGDLVVTGPTGTNVNDLVIGVVA